MWRVKTVTKFKNSFFPVLIYWNDNRFHLGIIKKLNFPIWFPPSQSVKDENGENDNDNNDNIGDADYDDDGYEWKLPHGVGHNPKQPPDGETDTWRLNLVQVETNTHWP